MQTTDSAAGSYLTPEFDDFLFARINEDSDETPLSVLSVLARLGVDPWEEAAKLAQLPRASATKKLVSLMAAIPGGRWPSSDAGTISDRLIALLPSPPDSSIPARQQRGIPTRNRSQFAIWAILIASILVIQLSVISSQPATQAEKAYAPSSRTVRP
jgi:hypothetical protein